MMLVKQFLRVHSLFFSCGNQSKNRRKFSQIFINFYKIEVRIRKKALAVILRKKFQIFYKILAKSHNGTKKKNQ